MAVSGVCSRWRAGRVGLTLVLAFTLALGVPVGLVQAGAADILVTTSETKLTGTLEEAHFSLEAFGTVLQLPLGFVSSLRRLESGQVRLELINHDVITGSLRNRVVSFTTPSARMTIPADKIKALTLQARQAPPEAVNSLLLTLRNGDEVAWPLSEEPVVVSLETSFSDPIRLQLDKIRELRLGDGDRDVVEVRNGDLLYGQLKDTLLRVHTYYQDVDIPQAEVFSLVFLSQAEAKVRFTGLPAASDPEPAAPAAPPAPSSPPLAPAAAPPAPVPAPPAKPAGPWMSAASLVLDTAVPLADPRVADAYQPFSGYVYGPTGSLAVAVGVPGVKGEKTGREIWVYHPNGKRVILGVQGEASSPAWSPDGTQLAYDFRPAGLSTSEIWLGAADGSSRKQLSRDAAGSHSSLAWAPDGKRLAYVARNYHTGTNGVWVLSLDKESPVQLLSSNSDYFSDLQWSPDGRRLLVVSGVPGAKPRSALKIVDVAGKVAADLFPQSGTAVNEHPSWSPDGQMIAFSSNQGGSRQIWVVRSDGTGLRQVTSGEEPKDYPVWSPDGAVLMYFAGRGGLGNLWLIDAAGGKPYQLTASGRIGGRGDWSRDGKKLVFTKREQNLQLWTATLATK